MITLEGKINAAENGIIIVSAPFDNLEYILDKRIRTAEITLRDGREITPKQRKKAYALFRDISDWNGDSPEYIKEYFKCAYVAETGEPEFSLSDVDETTASRFIDFLVSFCLEWDVPCRDSLMEYAEDIRKYLYLCLYHRKCAICGKKAEVHHIDAVGMGRNRNAKCHEGLLTVALCRKHHTEAHSVGNRAFCERYHIIGIPIDAKLIKRLKIHNKEIK